MNKKEAENNIAEKLEELTNNDALVSKRTICIMSNISFYKDVIIKEQANEIENLKQQLNLYKNNKKTNNRIL